MLLYYSPDTLRRELTIFFTLYGMNRKLTSFKKKETENFTDRTRSMYRLHHDDRVALPCFDSTSLERVVKRSNVKQYANSFSVRLYISRFLMVANSSRRESTSISLFLLFHKISSNSFKCNATRKEVEIPPISFERSLLILSSFPLIAIFEVKI
ncbi:hypothetical protein K0M31_015411 [Melipona bicolor]|uniref:Uncharacterized protein n=1 Tax=Melipona bicolor TaxID=60889 RepID=A0AA40FGP0_9HYME|nr:hypothetical protein K0M31_015411 [Melipona bicolor]